MQIGQENPESKKWRPRAFQKGFPAARHTAAISRSCHLLVHGFKDAVVVPQEKTLGCCAEQVPAEEKVMFLCAGNSVVSAVEEQGEEDLQPWDISARAFTPARAWVRAARVQREAALWTGVPAPSEPRL